ncbi:hypothetical protein EP56_08500 [Listeriaceae bacterium FSL A5-0209]|nr:hypothetical protein EP56_08500 [Listeriaceae bacterium FSL A5-0209]
MTQNEESRYECEKRKLAMIAGCYKMDKQEIIVEKNHLDLLIKLANERNELLRERENAETVYKYEGDTDCQYAKEEKQIDYRVNYGTGELSSIERGIKGVWIPDGEAENK